METAKAGLVRKCPGLGCSRLAAALTLVTGWITSGKPCRCWGMTDDRDVLYFHGCVTHLACPRGAGEHASQPRWQRFVEELRAREGAMRWHFRPVISRVA